MPVLQAALPVGHDFHLDAPACVGTGDRHENGSGQDKLLRKK